MNRYLFDEKGKIVTALAVLTALVVAAGLFGGCGKEEEGLQIETIENGQEEAGNDAAENAGQENAGSDAPEKADGGQEAGSVQLEGDVRSLSADSFVICKHETWTEDGASYAAAPAPGYEKEEDKITVRVAENCSYTYKTVKNGGINPEDVSEREGSRADVKEGLTVSIRGSWQDDGSFLADSIVMTEIV